MGYEEEAFTLISVLLFRELYDLLFGGKCQLFLRVLFYLNFEF